MKRCRLTFQLTLKHQTSMQVLHMLVQWEQMEALYVGEPMTKASWVLVQPLPLKHQVLHPCLLELLHYPYLQVQIILAWRPHQVQYIAGAKAVILKLGIIMFLIPEIIRKMDLRVETSAHLSG